MEHKEENRICQNCKINFVIESDDFSFYEKIKVPAPTFCPECRFARKLIWRNERSLYKRKCDLCQKSVISMYKENVLFPVYCHECWWGDKWSPLDYGRDYDFNIPFFEQFKKLQETVPRPASYGTKNVGSEYCNYTAHMKNCYLMFGSWFSEDCGYGQTVMSSKDCWDCVFVRNCESCFSCIDCTQCNSLFYSQKCSNCIESVFLYDCRNCQNCLFSYNLRNKNYHVFNKPVSKEEFHRIKNEIFSSHLKFENALSDFKKLIQEKAIHKFMTGEKNHDVSGEFISNSKNVHKSYYVDNGENEKYAVRGGVGQKDAMDVFGVHAGELVYESNNIDFSSRCLFSVNGENNIDSSYVVDCDHVNNLFGCIAMRKQEHCILNKKYSEKDYFDLKNKIITEMNNNPYVDKQGKIYKYGEFFPAELSSHSYNETLAQEYIPTDEKIANKLGYSWDSFEEKGYKPTKNWRDLPESIQEVDDSILSEIILCESWDLDKEEAQRHKCTKAFKITQNELSIYKKWGIPLPRKCSNTRYFEMFKQRNLVKFWHRKCMKENCLNEFETTYAPDRPEIVYCERCYQQEVY